MPACTLVVLLGHGIRGTIYISRDASALGALTSLLRRKVSWKLETPLSLISQIKNSGRVNAAAGGTSVLQRVGRDKGTPGSLPLRPSWWLLQPWCTEQGALALCQGQGLGFKISRKLARSQFLKLKVL